MKLYIKNMVCSRCKLVVKSELEKLEFKILVVDLGEVEIIDQITSQQKSNIGEHLKKFGFELIDDKKSRIIDKIKTLIIELVHQQNAQLIINLSDYLSNKLVQDYSTLSSLFSELEDTTIEKVKELLLYDELTLSEIAFQMNYSSVAYLSNQFKKVTGFSPTYFKQLRDKKRKQIEDL